MNLPKFLSKEDGFMEMLSLEKELKGNEYPGRGKDREKRTARSQTQSEKSKKEKEQTGHCIKAQKSRRSENE